MVDVERLVVDPASLRRGIGRALVEHVVQAAGPRRVVVSTGRANAPARRLYEGLGFAFVADEQPMPGLWVSRYEAAGAGAASR
jgi:GNAT superfamily N-acetyltransferase